MLIGLDFHKYSVNNPIASRKLAVAFLSVGQTLGWASFYYLFGALLLTWEQDLDWSKSFLTLGITTALIVSSLVSPFSGNVIDNGGGRWLLCSGMALGGLSLFFLAKVTEPYQFILLWALIGVAHGMSLYEPCFAFLSRNLKADAATYIGIITLAAGFASTIAYPSITFLVKTFDWQSTVTIFSIVILMVSVPLMYAGATMIECCTKTTIKVSRHSKEANFAVLKNPLFWLLFFGFPLIALTDGLILTHILPILIDKDLDHSSAVLAIALFGPMQVFGRFIMMKLSKHVDVNLVGIISFTGITISCVVLFITSSTWQAIMFAMLFGASYGLTSIIKPLMIAKALGYKSLGRMTGWLAVPYLMCMAIAPYLGSTLWKIGGYDLSIQFSIVVAILGSCCIIAIFYLGKRASAEPRE